LRDAEQTYALYGLNVDFVADGDVDTVMIPSEAPLVTGRDESLREARPETASLAEETYHNLSNTAYMLVTSDGGGGGNIISNFDWTSDPQGVASCNGNDVLWNYQVRHTNGDDDSRKDSVHGDISSNSPAPKFSRSSMTLYPSSPGGDTDTYKIWALCVPEK
jgi:hypothetical protein